MEIQCLFEYLKLSFEVLYIVHKDFLNLKHGIPIDNHYILEVKYNEFLPEIVKMSVQGISQKTSSYSKFAQCRMMDW